MKFRILLTLIILTTILGCQDDGDSSRRGTRPSQSSVGPSFRVRVLNAQGLTYGDSIHFEVKSDSPDIAITKLEISDKDGKVPFYTSEQLNFKVPSQLSGGGEIRLKLKAIYENGKSTTRYKEVNLQPTSAAKNWKFEVLKKYPHDVSAYTQGFLVYNGFIYEGTGNYGESRLRRLDLTTGQLVQEENLSEDIFGEGITIFDDNIYQVTYKSGRGFIYDRESFNIKEEFTYSTQTSEGWGLTHNDTSLILSDGSSTLYFLDPQDQKVTRRLNVFDENGNVKLLNELEYVDGRIFANIYTQPFIVELDATSGQVINRYDARGIVDQSEANPDMDVLNGIAIHPMTQNLLVTGKYWSKIYEVKPIPAENL
ncbi:MAG: glutaminyl-peptide cyclotransferase [Bacteroidota bacterium]